MIREIVIERFKRFKTQSFELKPLTVLTGRNGSGKTSMIHALLLVQQALQRHDGIVELNGPFGLELGWFEDLVNINYLENSFAITLHEAAGEGATWVFSKGDTELYASVAGPDANRAAFSLGRPHGFQYLAAERNGPRITQKASALPAKMLTVGCHGEFSAQVMEKLGSSPVDFARLCQGGDTAPLLKAQTEQWLSRIARPIEINTVTFPNTSVVSLEFRTPGGSWVRPTNMGFGVSYSLPIVLAALPAPTGGLLIVENPEAHLHPAGQSEIGVFLTRMAASGLQILVETHSDHVLNGVRRAIGEHGILKPEDAIVHFFPDTEEPVQSIAFTPAGGLAEWPRGLLDQYQMDVARLTRVRRPK